MVVDDRTTVGDAIAIVDYLLLDSIRPSIKSSLTSTWMFPVQAYVGIQYLELWGVAQRYWCSFLLVKHNNRCAATNK